VLLYKHMLNFIMCYMEVCAQDLICTLLRMVILNILIEWFIHP